MDPGAREQLCGGCRCLSFMFSLGKAKKGFEKGVI